MKNTIALLGAGWLGEPLARRLQEKGYNVKVATTQAEKAARLRASGLLAFRVELHPDRIAGDFAPFFAAEQLILTVPPGGRRDPEVEASYPAKIYQALKAAKAAGISTLLFTSSTGIYGDQQGLLNEASSLLPTTASGKALLQVEQLLRSHWTNQLTILRLAGLVGGKRQPGRWFAGKQEVQGGEQFVNLVHREDVLSIMERVVLEKHWGHLLNVCADEHPLKADFYPLASRAIGQPVPTFSTDFNREQGKIIDNARGKKVLDYHYRYPDPRLFPFTEE